MVLFLGGAEVEESVRQWHLTLPVGVRRDTRQLMTLGEAAADEAPLAGIDEMALAERIAVVRERWHRGEWSDLIYGTEGLFDLDRAIRELEAQTPAGRDLLGVSELAIGMALRHEQECRR